MEQVTFGRTGLKVSPAGLGCGGGSRLGMRYGNDAKSAERVVRHAIELGVNFFDTARVYGTEEVVGKATAAVRDKVVIASKTLFMRRDDSMMAADELVESLEKSLTRLNTDYVDVFSFHGVTAEYYPKVVDAYLPAFERQRELGKIRHLGITESFRQDPTHSMLGMALADDHFDAIMVGFNFLNSCARNEVLPTAAHNGVATQVMHAVRNALSNPEVLAETVARLIDSGEIEAGTVDANDPLGFLDGVAPVTDVAYRYCRHEPGVSVVLTGTGSIEHLEQNVAAICAPPLPQEITSKLDGMFGRVTSASGD